MINLIKKEREKKDMNDLNKLAHTKIGDIIDYYINGVPQNGTVVKMNNSYVSILKADGIISDVHVNDTFFVKDIIKENKTWNGMTGEERTEVLIEAHAFSPRFLSKTWEDLPRELQDVLTKTNIEESTHGQLGGNRAGISTNTDIKTPEDYKGETDDRDKQTKEEFKHDNDKPTVDKNNGMEEDHKKKDQFDGMKEDWRHTGGDSDKHKIKSTWESWLNKTLNRPSGFAEEGARTRKEGIEEGEKPTQDNPFPKTKTPKGHKAPTGVGKPKHGGHGYNTGNASRFNTSISDASKRGAKPLKKLKAWELWLEKDALDPKAKPQSDLLGDPNAATVRNTRIGQKPPQVKELGAGLTIDSGSSDKMIDGKKTIRDLSPPASKDNQSNYSDRGRYWDAGSKHGNNQRPMNKSYGKPLYGVTSLEKEGDGAGNSGVISTETTGVYNPRNVNSDGRYRDQERDKEDERNTRN